VAEKREEMKLSSSMEDYLEAIAILDGEKGIARVKDISRLMNVKNPSVTGALATLESNDLVRHEKYGYVELTSKGRRIAQSIQRRHDTFRRFLTLVLDIDAATAEKDSCMLEHAVSSETFEKLSLFIQFVESCPEEDMPHWLKNFYHYMRTGKKLPCERSRK
jgi:DtxR family Mn-dependent transcriptional regulator